jgi:predicted metal-dependent phosphoesterase TrpH
VDAIEIFNSRCMLPSFNRCALQFAEAHHLMGTVGSDAHAAFELGRSLVLLDPFDGPDDLRKVIRTARYQMRASPPWVHLTSRYATLRKKIRT